MKVKDILNFLDNKFPLNTAMDFDNVGLLIGNKESEINNVLITLDLTDLSLVEAINKNCELIITHHPVIFSPLKSILNDTIQYKLIKNNISVISVHTNLDIGNGGVNDCLCEKIGLCNIEKFITNDGFIIRSGTVESISPNLFAQNLKERLNTRVKFLDGKKDIKKVLVCSGSGGEYVLDAIKNGFDALVTADVKHHQFIESAQNEVSVYDCGHFETEDVVIKPLLNLLKCEFKDINFMSNHVNLIEYI